MIEVAVYSIVQLSANASWDRNLRRKSTATLILCCSVWGIHCTDAYYW